MRLRASRTRIPTVRRCSSTSRSAAARRGRSAGRAERVGKTTLAKVAAGLLVPGGGRVLRFGACAYLPQDPGRYLVTETALAEVRSPPRGACVARARATRTDGVRKAASADLSSGERERLAIATVLAVDPDLLVLDDRRAGRPERKRGCSAASRAGSVARDACRDPRPRLRNVRRRPDDCARERGRSCQTETGRDLRALGAFGSRSFSPPRATPASRSGS